MVTVLFQRLMEAGIILFGMASGQLFEGFEHDPGIARCGQVAGGPAQGFLEFAVVVRVDFALHEPKDGAQPFYFLTHGMNGGRMARFAEAKQRTGDMLTAYAPDRLARWLRLFEIKRHGWSIGSNAPRQVNCFFGKRQLAVGWLLKDEALGQYSPSR